MLGSTPSVSEAQHSQTQVPTYINLGCFRILQLLEKYKQIKGYLRHNRRLFDYY